MTFKVACIQNCASEDSAASLDEVTELCRRARTQDAELICLPEYVSCLSMTDHGFELGPAPEEDHRALIRLRELAEALSVWLMSGSLAVDRGDGRINNRAYLIDPEGAVVSRYDKIHLFDVDLAGGESYRESEFIAPGREAVLASTPWGLLGMSICYDLRFPHLYRELAKAGAAYLTVPAAFTKTTGQAHWHTLLRARAIECGAYVFAPCQYGFHGKAQSYGHSLIVDPWGRILADGGEGPGIIVSEVDPAESHRARAMIPALEHDREFAIGAPLGLLQPIQAQA